MDARLAGARIAAQRGSPRSVHLRHNGVMHAPSDVPTIRPRQRCGETPAGRSVAQLIAEAHAAEVGG
eukprot:CAMPEP_0176285654 /NCGR_PEP_ID=MMETSP0121_2-20121125/52485_1 /TAXON_ID=160619 /ORGANISM="Kryptoperidinium foliaceum, Strain CCMP 1326" /LENGTH=66 /DNA_ID=CAMNT_0017626153 /DNA_START=30 /DNA_END=226 /DNA_ORIENTATION=-